jgi:hypothetical protein
LYVLSPVIVCCSEDDRLAERRVSLLYVVEGEVVGELVDAGAGWEAVSEGGDEVGIDEVSSWFEDADHLGDRLPPVWNVMCRLVCVNEGELVVGEREIAGVGEAEADARGVRRGERGCLDLVGVDVDTDDVEAERGREVNGGGAVAAANIEQPIACAWVEASYALLCLFCDSGAVTGAVHESLLNWSHLHRHSPSIPSAADALSLAAWTKTVGHDQRAGIGRQPDLIHENYGSRGSGMGPVFGLLPMPTSGPRSDPPANSTCWGEAP